MCLCVRAEYMCVYVYVVGTCVSMCLWGVPVCLCVCGENMSVYVYVVTTCASTCMWLIHVCLCLCACGGTRITMCMW